MALFSGLSRAQEEEAKLNVPEDLLSDEHVRAELGVVLRDFADRHLRPGGNFLIKLFQGEGFDAYVKDLRTRYDKVVVRKPAASRRRSNEVYALATGKRRGPK